jgi:hypothetical protein
MSGDKFREKSTFFYVLCKNDKKNISAYFSTKF